MSVNDMNETSEAPRRGSVAVVIAAAHGGERLAGCLESLRAHSPTGTLVVAVPATPAAVNRVLEQLAPADVVVLSEPCRVSAGWLGRLRQAARSDTNVATASALVDVGGELALMRDDRTASAAGEAARETGERPATRGAAEEFATLADELAARTLVLRPRLTRAVAPCVYVRREAIELVGVLDEELDLPAALEIDFAQRCLLCGLGHVAADDVVVGRVPPPQSQLDADGASPDGYGPPVELAAPSPQLLARYPYLSPPARLAESAVLARALGAARGADARVWVTLDARALDGAVTGTQVHVLELILALARGGGLRLRVLVRAQRIDTETLTLLRSLPDTEVVAAEDVGPQTPRSTVFHRPQQAFEAGDVALALALGERLVISQLDLIAYRNPGYFAEAGAWEDYRRASRLGLAAAERVVVFSEHTRRELVADALVEEGRVVVVPPGLDHRPAGAPQRPAALDVIGGASPQEEPRGFLLCLGTDFRHKNRVFALRLLAALRERHGWRGGLVLAGTHIPHGSSRELERSALAEHPRLERAVIELGAVSEQEKTWLMERAGAVVYPSVYEGFGLVPFESALAGVPCVFAPQSSLAEAAPPGTATILPWDPDASAAAVHTLLCDADARAAHVQALAGAAGELTWAATATAMSAVYREAAVAPVREAATLSRDAVERERELTAAHEEVVQTLIAERELVLQDYNEQIAELGPGRGLIGPDGALPEDLQRALLALSARPGLSRPLYGGLARVFASARSAGHALQGRRGRPG
jgi:glycosyltransferase involved in cell wall biosynthesis